MPDNNQDEPWEKIKIRTIVQWPRGVIIEVRPAHDIDPGGYHPRPAPITPPAHDADALRAALTELVNKGALVSHLVEPIIKDVLAYGELTHEIVRVLSVSKRGVLAAIKEAKI